MGVFERIVCGVDGSEESLEAVRQADVLLEEGGRLALVAVVDLARAIHFQVAAGPVQAARHALEDVDALELAAAAALELARAEVAHAGDVGMLTTGGTPATCLVDAVGTERATLLAVGTHGLGRAAGILLGSVANRVLHDAPCSVLVARRPAAGTWTPRSVVVGVDDSAEAAAGLAAARELESRFAAELRRVPIDGSNPAHALVAAAEGADLLVVDARAREGRHHHRSLAEHVAHDARCSVLVVRGR